MLLTRAASSNCGRPRQLPISSFPLWLAPDQVRVHTMLVVVGRDLEAGAVSVRLHHGGPQGAKPKGEVVADILAGIKERRA